MGGFQTKKKNKTADSKYRDFWDWTGRSFPLLVDAPSTHYYRQCEQMLFRKYFPELQAKMVFKTDLWDEAKNTQILKWASDQGAKVFGLDISYPMVQEARKIFPQSGGASGMIVSDLRAIAFAAESFDYIYSMGTIEHFREYKQALDECFRVLKKGGIAIIGVPNKWDPFLRPAMVSFLYWLGIYSYGFEKSFSMRALEQLLSSVGFQILDRDGILFMPGWLRMADLFLHVSHPRLTVFTEPLIRPFAYLYRRFPALRRHGYLIACVVQKPT
jgi:SAM-dependent methyltransferase